MFSKFFYSIMKYIYICIYFQKCIYVIHKIFSFKFIKHIIYYTIIYYDIHIIINCKWCVCVLIHYIILSFIIDDTYDFSFKTNNFYFTQHLSGPFLSNSYRLSRFFAGLCKLNTFLIGQVKLKITYLCQIQKCKVNFFNIRDRKNRIKNKTRHFSIIYIDSLKLYCNYFTKHYKLQVQIIIT